MKKTKEQRLLDAIFAPDFQSLLNILMRLVVAEEAMVKQNERSIELQERHLALAEQGIRSSQDIAYVTRQTYAQRLMAAVRASTGEEEAP